MAAIEGMDRTTLASMIDQTLLKPTAGYASAAAWIERSREAGFATLCVSPFLVPLTAQRLAGTCTRVCSVVGFPLGYACTETKAEEARLLVSLGAIEIDMVMNSAALCDGDERLAADDIAAVVDAVRHASSGAGIVKVIIETGQLDEAQIPVAARLVADSGADYVKTSTGFGPRGATVQDVLTIRAAVGDGVGIKAAGGIRDLSTALAMVDAGANRIGTSSGIEILAALDAGNR